AEGVGEAAARHGPTLLLEPGGPLLVSRQQQVEGRALDDLCVELAGRGTAEAHAGPARRGESGGQLLRQGAEIAGHRHGDLRGAGARYKDEQQEGQYAEWPGQGSGAEGTARVEGHGSALS